MSYSPQVIWHDAQLTTKQVTGKQLWFASWAEANTYGNYLVSQLDVTSSLAGVYDDAGALWASDPGPQPVTAVATGGQQGVPAAPPSQAVPPNATFTQSPIGMLQVIA